MSDTGNNPPAEAGGPDDLVERCVELLARQEAAEAEARAAELLAAILGPDAERACCTTDASGRSTSYYLGSKNSPRFHKTVGEPRRIADPSPADEVRDSLLEQSLREQHLREMRVLEQRAAEGESP